MSIESKISFILDFYMINPSPSKDDCAKKKKFKSIWQNYTRCHLNYFLKS